MFFWPVCGFLLHWWLCDTSAISSTKNPDHPVGTKVSIEGQGCVPLSFCALSNLLPIRNNNGKSRQPCLTPVSTENGSER